MSDLEGPGHPADTARVKGFQGLAQECSRRELVAAKSGELHARIAARP